MKKAVLILLSLVLCGCSAQPVETTQTTAFAVSQTEIVKTTAITTANTVSVTTTAETATERMNEYWLSEYKWRIEMQEELREVCKTVEISEDAVFYECEYTRDGIFDSLTHPDTNTLINALDYFYTTESYKTIYDKAIENYVAQGGVIEGEFEVLANVIEAITFDFNSDGSEETAVLLQIVPDNTNADEIAFISICMALDYNAPRYLVLMDCQGNFSISNMNYSMDAQLYRLRYNGFSHLVITGGVSINSSCADFFSVEESGFVHKLREFKAYGIKDDIFLCNTMAQVSDNWLIFWSEEHNSYVTPDVTYLTPEESLKISVDFPEQNKSPVTIVGGNIYSEIGGKAYRLVNGRYEPFEMNSWYDSLSERRMAISREFPIPYVTNFDYERALKNIVHLE